jgi:multidrug efflux pump subunit AcrB
MSGFSIRNPYLIIVLCLMIGVVGVVSVTRMPVDLFPPINIPEVVVATFYNGMPPEDIEAQITGRFERFFTLGSGIDHMESRSLPGVSLVKIYFQPGTRADADATEISNLAMADLRRLPPGTLPPVVLQFDASSLPVCLVTLSGRGLDETQLHDYGQFQIRNQIAGVPGASIPPPFGGRYRQVMVYVNPSQLEAYQLSPMDVVRKINAANLILPAGDAKLGPFDYNIYTNSEIENINDINAVPLKTVGQKIVTVADVGHAEDASEIQQNIVRVNGQRSVYLPIMKQGGDTNTIAVVNGVRDMLPKLVGLPHALKMHLVFDQSQFVKQAIDTLVHEGVNGLLLTAIMILIFLGSFRATVAVFLSIPLSALAAFIALNLGGSTINAMILSGLALAFSRLIDNSVISLENIFRHMELGESPAVAAEKGGNEVNLAVLSATLATVVVFFPVTFLTGVSKFLFSALALAVALSLFASYFVAMIVVPLYCAKLMKGHAHGDAHQGGDHKSHKNADENTHGAERQSDRAGAPNAAPRADSAAPGAEGLAGPQHLLIAHQSSELGSTPGGGSSTPPAVNGRDRGRLAAIKDRLSRWGDAFNKGFNRGFERLMYAYEARVRSYMQHPALVVALLMSVFVASLAIFPLLGVAFFPRTDAGQFLINVKAQSGTRIEITNDLIKRVEHVIRHTVAPGDLKMIVSNIGVAPGLSAIYTQNSGPHTATVQVELTANHRVGSYQYMDRVRRALARQVPEVSTFFQTGGLQDAVLNMGLAAPIDIQVSGQDLDQMHAFAEQIAARVRTVKGVSSTYIPQDEDYPSLRIGVDRQRAAELGLTQKEVVDNMVTALTSNGMIAPSYWIDPRTGNDYMLTVQYPERDIRNFETLNNLPIHGSNEAQSTVLEDVSHVRRVLAPTEVDHYQIARVIDVYVMPSGEDLGRPATKIRQIVAALHPPIGVHVTLRGMVREMQRSFTSFAIGLSLAVVLLYLILVAQFRSFVDPVLILLAVPMGITGVLLTLWLTGTTLNVQSLMGVLMMVGIVTSNSILIVDFAHRLRGDGVPLLDAVVSSCRIRLRPILMTSLATIIGLMPMALKLGTGSEAYAPLARAIIGGLAVSVVLTIFIVPAGYLLIYGRHRRESGEIIA